ncbi:MAG: hypothetical protein ACRBB0_22795 [Pelagimonas sp.]|uniref:hypothetical protein n=1 Tax=Pelagimonas sp. TaxID=2073170 RepID=UPI00086CE849|nr:hypothetical protein AB838_18870 [Rhodobacteraceae bacterium (ex Bugula neritina AB1)]
MTIEEIQAAVDAGKPVRWANDGYHVTKDCHGQYLITFQPNQNTIGLTNRAGDKLNGQPEDFYIAEVAA